MTRIIPRAEWGARHPNGFGSRRIGSLDKVLHHSVTVAPDLVPPYDDDYRAMRQLEDIGQQRFGGGVSYSFAVSPAGLLFEGVGVDRIGAHTAGHNTAAVGIVLLGNYDPTPPTPEQEQAVAWLLQHGVEAGWWRLKTITWGHRQLKGTSCPGSQAFARIPAINALAQGTPITSATPVSNPLPPAAVNTRPRNADGSVRLEVDGIRGRATIGRWQEVLGTPIDFVITPPPVGSTLIEADQRFLNAVVDDDAVRALTGKPQLDEDGVEGKLTIKVRQYWLYNVHGPTLLGRGARLADFDGIDGPETTRLHQHALNASTARSGRY